MMGRWITLFFEGLGGTLGRSGLGLGLGYMMGRWITKGFGGAYRVGWLS
jgi:H+/gluconate symporter-like permease